MHHLTACKCHFYQLKNKQNRRKNEKRGEIRQRQEKTEIKY